MLSSSSCTSFDSARSVPLSVAVAGMMLCVVPACSEPTLISELLSNLLDNALAHTLGGGNVVLRVLDGAVLEVEDDGPGIPVAERDRVFARFYRRDTSGHGAGLGLAIVGEIVRAHRAEISLDQGALGGLLVRVRFIPAEG